MYHAPVRQAFNRPREVIGLLGNHPRSQAKKLKPGDLLLCYVTGVSRFIGVLEVKSEVFHDESPIWEGETYPLRVEVNPVVRLKHETAVPVKELKDVLSIFAPGKTMWQGKLRASPFKWTKADGEAVVTAVKDAATNPVVRPADPKLLYPKTMTKTYPTEKGESVTVPDETQDVPEADVSLTSDAEASPHTEIQWRLLSLGQSLGLDLWVANNDRSKQFNGQVLGDLKNMKSSLPLQFAPATMKTIQLIDVLWIQGNAIVAAFEIESTTSIYSGLLRMSDLKAMQPNLQIPLYLVAPDERRQKVFDEINRPTFSKLLNPPLVETCRFISFSTLKDKVDAAGELVKYLKIDFLDEISEVCIVV